MSGEISSSSVHCKTASATVAGAVRRFVSAEWQFAGDDRAKGRRALFLAAGGLWLFACAVMALRAPTAWSAEPTSAVHNLEVSEPTDYRLDDYRSPVPRTLTGATVVTSDQAEVLHTEGKAVFIDVYPRAPKPPNLPAGTVWRDPPHMSIAGSHWLPNVGYGVLSPEVEDYFKTRLQSLSGGDSSRPIVFFCLKDCWMSWNAAKRAMRWGYQAVVWFPDGTDGWQDLGNDLVPSKPMP